MTNDWNPNVPNIRKDFNGTGRKPPERPIATKAELDRLKAEREKPVLDRQLTPGGTLEQAVKRQVAASRRLDIATLEQRLGRMKGRAKRDFNRSR